MCLRYLARGRERWRSIRGPRRLRTTRRPGALARAHAPGNRAARKPPAAPGSPRLTGCADAAQQQLARRPGGALRSTRQEKATPCAPHRGISVGVPAHVITAIAPRSDGLSRSTHVQIASRVTALRRLCVMVLCRVFDVARWRPLRCGCWSKFKAFWTPCVLYAAILFLALRTRPEKALLFFLPLFPRRRDASDAIKFAKFRAHPPRKYPKTTGSRRHDAANDARAVGDAGNHNPPPRAAPTRHGLKHTQKQP